MPYAISYVAPGNETIYARVKQELGEPPPALLMQLVTHADGGLRHTMVWESRDAWRQFQEDLGPAIGRVLASIGVSQPPEPPDVDELRVVDVMTR